MLNNRKNILTTSNLGTFIKDDIAFFWQMFKLPFFLAFHQLSFVML